MSKINENRPGYKETKIGWIPEDWEVTKIREIAEVDPESLKEQTKPNYCFYYISLSNIEKGRIVEGIRKISFKNAPSRARKIIKERDILLATVRPNLQSFYYFDLKEDNYIASTGFAIIRSSEIIYPLFLFYTLFSYNLCSQFYSLVVGSNYPAINTSDVKGLQIPLSLNKKKSQPSFPPGTKQLKNWKP